MLHVARTKLASPVFRTLIAAAVVGGLLVPAGAGLDLGRPASRATIDGSLVERLQANLNQPVDFLVSLDAPTGPNDAAWLEGLGFQVLRLYNAFGGAYVVATGRQALDLASHPRVLHLGDPHAPLDYYLETATVATRVRELWDGKSTSTPLVVGGNVADGTGVGIAIIDSGVDATHPDLAPAVATNLEWVCTTPGLISTLTETCFGNWFLFGNDGCFNPPSVGWVPRVNSDDAIGHGTHVSGIAAGRGVVSDGRMMGAAPGATIHMLAIGDAIPLFVLEGLNWVKCNHLANNIQVVSLSLGLNSEYDPADLINVASTTLAGDGVTVVWAAGNDGAGAANTVNTFARNPTPGVLSVANYDDQGKASRAGTIAASSSRCLASEAGTEVCPDVAAPGTGTRSTVAPNTVIRAFHTDPYFPYYGLASGTSMATPHVAGVVAVLNQVAPGIAPSMVETILESTAIPFASAAPYPSRTAGAGLVDAVAAAAAAANTTAAAPYLPQLRPEPHVYANGAVDGQTVGQAQWTATTAVPVVFDERFLISADAALWPIAAGLAANWLLVPSAGAPVNLATTVTADVVGFHLASPLFTFPSTGTWTVEAQIDFGSGLVAFDGFAVEVPV